METSCQVIRGICAEHICKSLSVYYIHILYSQKKGDRCWISCVCIILGQHADVGLFVLILALQSIATAALSGCMRLYV